MHKLCSEHNCDIMSIINIPKDMGPEGRLSALVRGVPGGPISEAFVILKYMNSVKEWEDCDGIYD